MTLLFHGAGFRVMVAVTAQRMLWFQRDLITGSGIGRLLAPPPKCVRPPWSYSPVILGSNLGDL